MIGSDRALAGWIPFRVRAGLKSCTASTSASEGLKSCAAAAGESAALVDWCFLGEDTFSDPFFEQTIERAWRRPFTQLFAHETPIEALLDWRAAHPGIAPTAFIFHSSRCGSTLLAQMAASLAQTVVISEAPPVDHVLRARASEDVRVEWLRGLLSALGQPRRGDERHLFVKFDAWHIMDLALVQRAFPRVPCVFLYREPAEVLASQLRMPGIHMIPGALDTWSVGIETPAARLDEYPGQILSAVYAAAVRHAAAGRITLMNYAELPGAGSSQVLAWCGLATSDEARERLRRVAQYDAKAPSLPYDATDRSPRLTANQRTIDIAARFVDPHYAQLESIRLGTADRMAAPGTK